MEKVEYVQLIRLSIEETQLVTVTKINFCNGICVDVFLPNVTVSIKNKERFSIGNSNVSIGCRHVRGGSEG